MHWPSKDSRWTECVLGQHHNHHTRRERWTTDPSLHGLPDTGCTKQMPSCTEIIAVICHFAFLRGRQLFRLGDFVFVVDFLYFSNHHWVFGTASCLVLWESSCLFLSNDQTFLSQLTLSIWFIETDDQLLWCISCSQAFSAWLFKIPWFLLFSVRNFIWFLKSYLITLGVSVMKISDEDERSPL